MKVKCPQCGKVYDLPKAQTQRLLKCLCQALFRPTPLDEKEDKDTKKSSSEIVALEDSQQPENESRISFVEDDLKEYESSISDNDIDSYISDLKQSREKIVKVDSESKPTFKNHSISMRLELDQKTKPKNAVTEIDRNAISDVTIESDPEELSDPISHDELATEPVASVSPRSSKVVERPSVRPKYQMAVLAVAMGICVLVGYFVAQSFKEQPEPPDPYLTKLLTAPPVEKKDVAAPIETPKVEQPQKSEPPVKSVAAPAKKEKKVATKKKPASKKSYDPAATHLAAGIMLLNSNPKKAAKEFEIALNLSPNNSQVWMNYGYALLKQKKLQAALGALHRSLDLHENDQVHYLMALTLVELSRKDEAVQHAKKAARLNPSNSQAKALVLRFEKAGLH